MAGITGFGGYIPRLRMSRKAITEANAWVAPNLRGKGRGERSMGNWDEDTVTMAVEAARDVLPAEDRTGIDSVYFASTTFPFADRQNAGIVAAALTLNEGLAAVDVASATRSGTTALMQALAASASGVSKEALVLASEHKVARAASAAELDQGDGAAAFTVGTDNVLATYLGGHSVTVDFVDHFRAAGEEFDYAWEERWIRDEGYTKIVPPAIEAALKKVGVAAADISTIILPTQFPKLAQNLAKKSGLDPDKVVDELSASCGNTGSAHALVLLSLALENAKPGDKILVCQFGQGCDVLFFEATDKIGSVRPHTGVSGWLADRQEETNYMKFLTFRGLVEWEKGMRAEQDNKTALTTLYRHKDQILGLVGGRCSETGVAQFPRSRISVNPNNHTVDTQEPYKFAERKASILSWSADYLSFSMAPPNHYGMIVFEGGGRIFMDITDVAPGDVDSGTDVRMVFRVKDFDKKRGFTRYFWKAVPVRNAAAGGAAQAAE